MQVYKVCHWENIYENSKTREVKMMKWVPLPIKLDGDGYTEMMDQDNTGALFGAWCATLELASRCDPRGTLIRGATGLAHDAASISRITRIEKDIVCTMLNLCVESLRWLEIVEISTESAISQESATLSQKKPPTIHNITIHNNTIHNIKKRSAKVFADDSIAVILSEYLYEKLKTVNSELKKPNIQLWAKDIDLILRVDKRTQEQVYEKIDAVFSDTFWRQHILSANKLRIRWNEGKLNKLISSGSVFDDFK